MKKICDLHTHSVFSDGTWTPEQLIEEAEHIGLSAIALTDHNTVDGLSRFLAAAEGKNLEAVPGVEFSTDYLGLDIHMVALYVMPDHFKEVSIKMEAGKRKKDESNRELVENLQKAGYPIDYEAICRAMPGGLPNRANIAAAMVQKGWAQHMQDAFKRFLEPECGFYNPPKRPDIFEIIGFIRALGAVPVMAHPFLKLNEQQLRVFLPKAKECGLKAMETEYVLFDRETTARAKSLAKEYKLLESGGSDFHGLNKPGIFLGVGKGNLQIPLSFRDGIRAEVGI